MSRAVTEKQLFDALTAIGKPGGRQLQFLQAHFDATGRAATATQLAQAAGYKSWRTLNLHYGVLARRIGERIRRTSARLGLLVEFSGPGDLTNEHWVLFMRPEFASALSQAGWVHADQSGPCTP